jgi:hypothetical protein
MSIECKESTTSQVDERTVIGMTCLFVYFKAENEWNLCRQQNEANMQTMQERIQAYKSELDKFNNNNRTKQVFVNQQ